MKLLIVLLLLCGTCWAQELKLSDRNIPPHPLSVISPKNEELFCIKENGDFVLRGKVIAHDKEVAEICKNVW